MSWLMDTAKWFNDNLGFGAIDKVMRDRFGFSTIPSALGYSGGSSTIPDVVTSFTGGTPSSSGGTSDLNNEMAFNASEAQKARDWQEHMRDTSLSSAFQQARDNGINPYVMFNGGGVSTPGASAASYSGYAAAERSAQQSGINSLLSAISALAVAKMPKTSIIIK